MEYFQVEHSQDEYPRVERPQEEYPRDEYPRDEYPRAERPFARKKTKKIRVGSRFIGGDAPISVQSMTNTDTCNVDGTVKQVKRLEDAGCDIVRVAVPGNEAALAIKAIKSAVKIPVVADIHFNYRLAIASIENGADKIRINPGNIGGEDKLRRVVEAAKSNGIPIRVGVNSGSVEKDMLKKYGGITPECMVESALRHVSMMENLGFKDIVISLKASSVPMTIASYRLISQKVDYPLHLGVTEAGTMFRATVKSAAALGCLLAEGIGDTIRVSITGDPVEEVRVGREILRALEIERKGIEIISCPTCGRCRIDLVKITNILEDKLKDCRKNIKVAVMGCGVNGPGEAKEADIGVAGGNDEALLFKKGKVMCKVPQDQIADVLLREIENMDST